jgi:hypothetical protein
MVYELYIFNLRRSVPNHHRGTQFGCSVTSVLSVLETSTEMAWTAWARSLVAVIFIKVLVKEMLRRAANKMKRPINLENWAIPALVDALVADMLWPDQLLSNILYFRVLSPEAASSSLFSYLVHTMGSGFIDQLLQIAHSKRPDVFLNGLLVFTGALVTRRLLTITWRITTSLLTWNNLALTLGIWAVRRYLDIPPSWKAAFTKAFAWTFSQVEGLLVRAISIAGVATWRFLSYAGTTFETAISTITRINHPLPEPFTYASAPAFEPSTQIRLLKLHRKLPFRPLSAELVSHTLADAPPYYAISYAWSHGPQDVRTFLLNGMPFHSTGNVHDILVNCSSAFGDRFIWIDSLCIDQSNAAEKSLQVRVMRDIYARAAHVLVCLGGGPWTGHLTRSLVAEMMWVGLRHGAEGLRQHVARFRQREKTDCVLRARIKALVELQQHPWFERVWVVQEAVVARQVTFFWGGHAITWEEMGSWKDLIAEHGVIWALAQSGAGSVEEMNAVSQRFLGFLGRSAVVGCRMSYQASELPSVAEVLRLFASREATVPVDKVFALVGLARESADDNLQRLIDYDRPPEETMLELAQYLLDQGQALQVLDFAGLAQRRRNPSLPSWVVDWTARRAGEPLNNKFLNPNLRYRATRDRPGSARRGRSPREIVVRGQYVDRIRCLTPLDETWPDMGLGVGVTAATYLDKALELARETLPNRYPYAAGGQSLEEAVWRTLIGDRTQSARPAPASCGKTMRTMLGSMGILERRLGSDWMLMDHTLGRSLSKEFGLTPGQEEDIDRARHGFREIRLLYDSGKYSRSLVFCVTENGYLAMVPHPSQVGDCLCLIHGLDEPYVLRACEEGAGPGSTTKCRLVGNAYVHGIMDGEALGLSGDEEYVLV